MGRILPALAFGVALISAADNTANKDTRSRQAENHSSTTGCVDQRGETYILTKEGTMEKAAVLRGRAFSNDNFARFIGQKVKVTGETKDGAIQVDRIEKIADTCR